MQNQEAASVINGLGVPEVSVRPANPIGILGSHESSPRAWPFEFPAHKASETEAPKLGGP